VDVSPSQDAPFTITPRTRAPRYTRTRARFACRCCLPRTHRHLYTRICRIALSPPRVNACLQTHTRTNCGRLFRTLPAHQAAISPPRCLLRRYDLLACTGRFFAANKRQTLARLPLARCLAAASLFIGTIFAMRDTIAMQCHRQARHWPHSATLRPLALVETVSPLPLPAGTAMHKDPVFRPSPVWAATPLLPVQNICLAPCHICGGNAHLMPGGYNLVTIFTLLVLRAMRLRHFAWRFPRRHNVLPSYHRHARATSPYNLARRVYLAPRR